MTDKHHHEWSLAESIKKSIEDRLTGYDEPMVIGEEPARRFSVGVLNANRQSDRAKGDTSLRPDSIGFYIRLKTTYLPMEFKCQIKFSIYYRVRPSFTEIMSRISGEPAETEKIPIIPKYRRIDKLVEGLISIPEVMDQRCEIDCKDINRSLEKTIFDARQEIAEDEDSLPGPKAELLGKALRSKDSYLSSFLEKDKSEIPTWKLILRAEMVNFPGHRRLLMLLTNASDSSEFGVAWHQPQVFNARIELGGKPGCFAPEPFTPVKNDYRYKSLTWGKGINTGLYADNVEGTAWTEHLPSLAQPRLLSRIGFETVTDTQVLASKDCIETLQKIETWLRQYGEEWDAMLSERCNMPDDNASNVKNAMLIDRQSYEHEIDRFKKGLKILTEDSKLLKAFRLMNLSFRESGIKNWRLFQICFVVNCMPSLYAREHPEVEWARAENDIVDVIWFPTGGGKTEAFLAVVVTALFYDRLRGKLGGVTAWIRYPLRMLSVQQLQRLIDIVVHAERVRLKETDLSNLGDQFAVGYYVGSQNAPNELTFPGDGADLIDNLYKQSCLDERGLYRYRVLSYCPMCGSESIKVEVDPDAIRIKHVCRTCNFIAPLYISDSEIYRYTPSVLVGTVDRLARAGETDRFSVLFTGQTARCPVHGYVSFGSCIEAKRCKQKLGHIDKFKDAAPTLLIQDEIHLLRESLGTYDSHYEGLVDVLSEAFGCGMRPKRLAATATIEGLEQHVYQLYVRNGRCFPVKGMKVNNSAYNEEDNEGPPARLYVGVLPSGRDADDVARTVAERCCELGSHRNKQNVEDPNYDLLLIYVNEKNTAGDVRSEWSENVTVQVLTGEKSLEEVRETIGRVKSDGTKEYSERLHAIIATSVISHGVDLDRLNQMVIVGMPRSAAEYIQASSRCGRNHVGIIFTIFRWRNRRDVSMYEHFRETHERLYQLVQPVPVNRVSALSIERTVTGLLASMVYNLFGPQLYASKGLRLYRATDVKKARSNKDLWDGDVSDAVAKAYFSGYEMTESYRQQLREIVDRIVKNQLERFVINTGYAFHTRLDPKPVSSLREVGDQIEFGLKPKDATVVKWLNY